MPETLKPLTLGEILDRTVQLYRRNFLSFSGIAAVPSAVILLVMIPVFVIVGFAAVAQKSNQSPSIATIVLLVLLCLVAAVVGIGATVLSQAALVRAAIAANAGQKLPIREALASVRPRFWRYVGLLFLQGIWIGVIPGLIAGIAIAVVFLLARAMGGGAAILAGFLSFFLGAAAFVIIVIRGLTYSLAMPACIAEEKPAWPSMQRSKQLSEGTRGRIFLMFLLIWALSIVVSMIGYIPTAILAIVGAMSKNPAVTAILLVVGQVVNLLVNFAMQVLITPVYMTALVLFYYDQRIRTEGYDIEWMMQQAGLAGGSAQTLPVISPEPDAETGH